jgi:hypothetical protein
MMEVHPLSRESSSVTISGLFYFDAKYQDFEKISDSYELKIVIPSSFPIVLPTVIEIGSKIPHDQNYHINSDGTLCLGNPFRLMLILSKNPDLNGFAEKCLVPFLYSISYKLKHGDKANLPFGELEHGSSGLIEDCLDLFELKTQEQVVNTLEILRKKKKEAEDMPCPCGCGRRLRDCQFNAKIIDFRNSIGNNLIK